MKKFITADEFLRALVEHEVVPESCTNVIIEARVGEVVRIYYSLIGDEGLLEVIPPLAEAAVVKTSNWERLGRRLLWKSASQNAPS